MNVYSKFAAGGKRGKRRQTRSGERPAAEKPSPLKSLRVSFTRFYLSLGSTRLTFVFVILFYLFSGTQSTLAHGYIVRSIPEDRVVLERAPTRLQYWFSEDLEPEFSSITVRDQNGNVIAIGGTAEGDNSLLTVRLPTELPDGAYVAELRIAFASDGHVTIESRVFFMGEVVGGISGTESNAQANTLEVTWRVLVLSSSLLLFGAFTLYTGVLIPAWGNPTYRAGLLPPRLIRVLNGIVIVALIVAFAGNILAIIQQAMVFFNADLGQVISQGMWNIVRIGTRFGDVWNIRMLLLALVALLHGLSIHWRVQFPDEVRAFWTANAWAMALVLGTVSVASHAAGSLLWPWAALLADWLHGLAVGFWVGGLAALVLILPTALAPYQGENRRLALLAVLKRFSAMAVAAVAVVITTGLYSASNWVYKPADLTQTPYGGTLVLKGLLVGAMLLVGLAHYAALKPERYQRWSGVIGRVSEFTNTLRLELVLALLALVIAALLSATPVPIPDFARQTVEAPSETQTVGDLTVTMTISPGGPGVNTYDTLITRDGQTADELSVDLQTVYPALDRRSLWQQAESAADGLYVAAGDDIDRTGQWWMLVDITACDQPCVPTRAAFEWTITADAAIIQAREPGVMNLVIAAGVLSALGFAVYPTVRRFYRQLDLTPVNLTIALGAVLAAVLFIVIGAVVTEETQARYEESLYPTPQVVNTVLPDAASLERGKTLYDAGCQDWAGDEFEDLIERLPRTRDEELFAATRDGWHGLTACDGVTSDEQRWDVVNYMRTFEEKSND
jgi:copper transport protein